MATTWTQVLKIAKAEVSSTPKEYPVGSNNQKYGAWYGWNGVAWCAQFISWVFNEADGLDHIYGKSASVWVIADRFRKANKYGSQPRVGALAIFNNYSHIELVTGYDQINVQTIGGNTSWAAGGSWNNGVYVAEKSRSRAAIMGYCYPVYDYYVPLFSPLAVDGDLGELTVTALQKFLNHKLGGADLRVDGAIGPMTYLAIQRWLGRAADSWNSSDVKALQYRVGATVDGVWGEETTAELQRYLNKNRSYLVEVLP